MRLGLAPSLAFQMQQARQNSSLRLDLQRVSEEAVTGRHADTLSATQGREGDVLLLQKNIADIDRFREATALAGGRLDAALNSLEQIRINTSGFASDTRLTVLTASENTPGLDAITAQAEGLLSQVTSALNVRSGSRHVFGGNLTGHSPISQTDKIRSDIRDTIETSATATDALTAIDNYFSDTAGGFYNGVYSGSVDAGPRLHLTQTQSLDPIPSADHPAFKAMMQGLALISEADAAASFEDTKALMTEGISLIERGSDAILRLEARMGASRETTTRVDAALAAERTLLSDAENNILGRDIYEAAAELQSLRTQLEASFTITGRLGSLSLSNFLR